MRIAVRGPWGASTVSSDSRPDCPHYSVSGKNSIRCECLATVGVTAVASDPYRHYPCARCNLAWRNGIPPKIDDRSTWTPAMDYFVDLHGIDGEKVEPARAEPLPKFADFLEDFERAAEAWRTRGHLVTDAQTFESRRTTCMGDAQTPACREWSDAKQKCTVGACTACSTNTMHMASQKCPLKKWPEHADPT